MSLVEAIACLNRTLATIDAWTHEEETARPSRPLKPSADIGSCTRCRSVKAKCSTEEGATRCSRCDKGDLLCEFVGRGRPGRKKGFSRKAILLQETRKDLVDALDNLEAFRDPSGNTPNVKPSPSARIPSSVPSPHPSHHHPPNASSPDVDGVLSRLENPLAVLANLAVHRDESAELTERGSSQGEGTAQAYFGTGLYDTRDECLDNDPIRLGLLTEEDLGRFVDLYFLKLWPYLWQLTPQIHTPQYFRATSPFLTTCFAAAVAMYDPLSSPEQARNLQEHAEYLAVEVFRQQYRTLEVVQGFCFLAHWLPPSQSWSQDRSYSWIGMAVRIATELCLQEPFKMADFTRYRRLASVSDDLYPLFVQERTRAWTLLFCADLAISVHTGRVSAVSGLKLIGGFRARIDPPETSNPYYVYLGNEALNRILVKALVLASGLEEEADEQADLRNAFAASWHQDLEHWKATWFTSVDTFIRVHYLHIKLMLLSICLRFDGPIQPILEECHAAAMHMVLLVSKWDDGLIEHASNFCVVNIALGATLVLKFLSLSDPASQPDTTRHVLELCEKVVQALQRIAGARINAASIAAVHAVRIDALIRNLYTASLPIPTPQPLPSHAAITLLPLPSLTPSRDPSQRGSPDPLETTESLMLGFAGELGPLEHATSMVDAWSWDPAGWPSFQDDFAVGASWGSTM